VNVTGAVGLAAALEEACADMATEAQRVAKLKQQLIDAVTTIPGARINTPAEFALPTHLNVSFPNAEGDSLIMMLDAAGMPLLEGTGLSGTIIAISLAVGLAVTVVGALLPAREAALTHPVEAMRGVSGSREKSLVLRTILGGLLLAAGAAAIAAADLRLAARRRR